MTYSFDIGAFSGALILALAGAFAYWNQRRIDREHELKMRRRELYAVFMTSIAGAVRGDGEAHLQARLEATVVASDKVLSALAEYNEYAELTSPGSNVQREVQKFGLLLAAVILAMREDVFEKSSVPLEEYQKLLPIS